MRYVSLHPAGYQNKLLVTNSQTVHTNDLDDAWAGCKAGYRIPGHSKSWTVVTWLHCHVALNSALALLRTRQIHDYAAIQLCGYLDT